MLQATQSYFNTFLAKSLIEEFYGLNELEYETEDDQDICKDNLIIGELKRKSKSKNFFAEL
jgi:hypothetical protein